MHDPIIRVKNLYKSYGELVAVNNLSFEVRKASCFGFLGPNGAGKTTLMKTLYNKATRDKNPETEVCVFGLDPQRDELSIKARTGVVPQENNLDDELNVIRNLNVFARLNGVPRVKADERIRELLEFMELKEKKSAKITDLSGGMKRRLTIARSLINKPQLLILDEPTTGLDPQVRHVIWNKLRSLKKEGVTILLTTHYMEEAFQICDRIIIMDKGGKVMEGNPAKLLKENIEEYVLEIHHKQYFTKVKDKVNSINARVDDSHEIILVYSSDLMSLKDISMLLPAGEFFLRQSNLEDLFLKITGRKLNESQ
jgi:lipooligosaccharide transport system ATP-binding protein